MTIDWMDPKVKPKIGPLQSDNAPDAKQAGDNDGYNDAIEGIEEAVDEINSLRTQLAQKTEECNRLSTRTLFDVWKKAHSEVVATRQECECLRQRLEKAEERANDADFYEEDIDWYLPVYTTETADGTEDDCGYRDRIMYAGEEIEQYRKLVRTLADPARVERVRDFIRNHGWAPDECWDDLASDILAVADGDRRP